MKRLSIVLTFVVIYIQGTPATVCSNRLHNVIGNREIRLFNEKSTFAEAGLKCRIWGNAWKSGSTGKLVTIKSLEDQRCIENMVSVAGNYKPWQWQRSNIYDPGYYIGASDLKSEGKWSWQDHSLVSYANWAWSEPNNHGAFGEDCAQMMMTNTTHQGYEAGKWIDVPCNLRKFYICERDISSSLLWGYENNLHAMPPSRWHHLYPTCAGERQSPISVESYYMSKCGNTFRGIKGWRSLPRSTWIVENTGRYIKIRPKTKRSTWTLFSGNSKKYYVDYMILKWGNDANLGSDHAIDGRRFSAELQVFHESHSPGQRHALAFMIEERSYQSNSYWTDLLRRVSNAQEPGLSSEMPAPRIGLRKLLKDSLPHSASNGWWLLSRPIQYRGSLPHPPCTEDVIWTVFFLPIRLSFAQFKELRLTRMEGRLPMSNNIRPLQAQRSSHEACTPTI